LLFIAILIISSLCLTDDNKGNGYSENQYIEKNNIVNVNYYCEDLIKKLDGKISPKVGRIGGERIIENSKCSGGSCFRITNESCYWYMDDSGRWTCMKA
jgi:hypothetical protein